jgi:hypothetical protein
MGSGISQPTVCIDLDHWSKTSFSVQTKMEMRSWQTKKMMRILKLAQATGLTLYVGNKPKNCQHTQHAVAINTEKSSMLHIYRMYNKVTQYVM